MDELEGLFDRDQILSGGAPDRRAASLVFLIETRAARLAAHARERMVRSLSEGSTEERALEFVEAFSAARDEALRPSVHDLERQADRWAPLVPRNPRLQAALARRLGERYRFTPKVAPGIAKALGLDDPEVRAAYDGVPAVRLSFSERLRWTWTRLARRLESLPGFWMAFALTLTETVTTDILALPIAVASLGPLPAIGVLVAIGVLNVVTIAFVAEAVVRTGPMRYGNAYLGRLFESTLGPRGSLPASALLVGLAFVWIPVCYVGIGRTLGDLTPVPAAVWVVGVFAVTVLYLRRGSLNATVATALAVGAVNLVLLGVMCALAAGHIQTSNLTHTEVPFVHGHPFTASVLALVFGVVLLSYFGHLSAATGASLVLDRDVTGRSLIWGCVAAQVTAIVLYSLFVLTMNGALGVDALAGADGTVISPLADTAGTAAVVIGAIFVVFALGQSSVMEGLSLSWLVEERLPSNRPRRIVLPRRRAELVFRAGRRLRVGVTYLGDSRFAIDEQRDLAVERQEVAVTGSHELLDGKILLEVLEADDRRARVAVTTQLRMAYEGDLDTTGLDLGEVLRLSDAEGSLVAALARLGEASPAAVAAEAGVGETEAAAMLESLLERGMVAERSAPGEVLYTVRLAQRRARTSALWETLSEPQAPSRTAPKPKSTARRRDSILDRPAARLVVSLLPLTVAFAIGEVLVLADIGSFAGLLAFIGVVVVSLLAGLYPVLLIVSSRRRGEYDPAFAPRAFGNPVLLGAIYAFFLAVLIVHGAFIWDLPAERVGAFAAAALMVVLPVVIVRGGAFVRRLTVEVQDDRRSGTARFAVRSSGRPATGTVTLAYPDGERQPRGLAGEIDAFDSLRSTVFSLGRDTASRGTELKVWAHRVTEEGDSASLPAVARLLDGSASAADLSLSRGEAVFPVGDADLAVEIVLKQ